MSRAYIDDKSDGNITRALLLLSRFVPLEAKQRTTLPLLECRSDGKR